MDAGKTSNTAQAELTGWDHPRGCGENLTLGQPSIVARGSPPRMRGKRETDEDHAAAFGITPADAGKTKPS